MTEEPSDGVLANSKEAQRMDEVPIDLDRGNAAALWNAMFADEPVPTQQDVQDSRVDGTGRSTSDLPDRDAVAGHFITADGDRLWHRIARVSLENLSKQIIDGRPLAINEFSEVLAESLNCSSPEQLLETLLPIARACGLENIRCYSLEDGSQKTQVRHFCSRSSAGHDDAVSQHIRRGEIVKFVTTRLMESDSFWVAAIQTPIAFVVDDEQTGELKCIIDSTGIPWMRLNDDPCGRILSHQSWVDFPIRIGGELVAKLSCDTSPQLECRAGEDGFWQLSVEGAAAVGDDVVEGWLTFQRIVDACAGQLDRLLEREVEDSDLGDVFNKWKGEIEIAPTPGDASEFLTSECVADLSCDEGRFLTIEHDEFLGTMLVERSVVTAKGESVRNSQVFALMDMTGITGFVARTGQGMCLRELGSDASRKKLRQFGSEIECAGIGMKPQDNIIAVQVPSVRRFRGGVLQLVQRGKRDEWHSERFRDDLEEFCQTYVAPKFEELIVDTAQKNVERVQRQLDAKEFRWSVRPLSRTLLHDVLVDAARETFGKTVHGSNWVCRINIKHDEHRFVHNWDGTLPVPDKPLIPFGGTLTKHVMTASRCVSVLDAEYAAQIGKNYKDNSAVSALGCRLQCGSQIWGAIILESDCFDLTVDLHGPMLQAFAHRAAALIAASEYRMSQHSEPFIGSLRDILQFITCGMDEEQRFEACLSTHDEKGMELISLSSEKRGLLKDIVWDACRIGWRRATNVNIEVVLGRDRDGGFWIRLGFTWPGSDVDECPLKWEFQEAVRSWTVGIGLRQRCGKLQMNGNALVVGLPWDFEAELVPAAESVAKALIRDLDLVPSLFTGPHLSKVGVG